MTQIDMEMPTSCEECKIWSMCWAEDPHWWKRREDCPLHEVTTDTDTVSRKAVISAINNLHDKPNAWLDHAVEAVKALPPSPSRPQEQRYGYWMRMSDLNESEDDRYKCSCCGNVVHHRDKVFLYTYNSWCGACGADMISKDAHGAWRRHATKGGAV